MTLAAGTKLGSYEILGQIGAGGMGEVYRARDLRLARDVAIKVLPEELFEGEERRQRFEREAKLLAAPHPRHGAPRGGNAPGGARGGEAFAAKVARLRAAGRGRARGGAREGD